MHRRLRVALFAPCFVDRLWPHCATAAWQVLRALGVAPEVVHSAPACCGQPMCSMGQPKLAEDLPGAWARAHADFDVVVNLSASCTAFVRHHHPRLAHPADRAAVHQAPPTRSFSEFLWHDLGLRTLPGQFPFRVGLHPGCHGLRELGLAPASEAVHAAQPDIPGTLLASIDGLVRTIPTRADECCGFGGAFSLRESAVSARMAQDRLSQFPDAEVLTSTDPSCLMHLARHLGPHGPRLLTLPELLLEALEADATRHEAETPS